MSNIVRSLFFLFLIPCFLSAQEMLLQSGPMVGYAKEREVALWVQTRAAAKVKFVYWDSAQTERKLETKEISTTAQEAFTARLSADKVQPGKTYFYDLYINRVKVQRPYPLRFTTRMVGPQRGDPPSFRMALGSCAYINDPAIDPPKGYGGEYYIFNSIAAKHPDLMLWMGDNVYFRNDEWNSREGMIRRYTHTRSTPEMQALLGSAHNYALWDDHDFGPDDSDGTFWNKPVALETFKLFWANPSYGVKGKPGVATSFVWGDVEFFLLDDRYYRTPDRQKEGVRTMLGQEQFDWLINALAASRTTFKLVVMGGQVLNPIDFDEVYNTYPDERAKLLALIREEKVKGVIFLTGDRHHSELSKLEREGTYPLYDLTVSPLTSGPDRNSDELNTLRVPATFVAQRNFGILEFTGRKNDRSMKITVYDSKGRPIWARTIKAKDLQ